MTVGKRDAVPSVITTAQRHGSGARLCSDPRGRDGGIHKKLAPRMKKKKERRVYLPRVLGSGKIMMPADLNRLHKYMLEIEHISIISDEVRAVVEEEWPEASTQTAAEETAGLSTSVPSFARKRQ